MRTPLLCKLILCLCLGFAQSSYPINSIEKFDAITHEILQVHLFNESEARSLIDKLKQIASQSPDNTLLTSQCYYWEAFVNYSQGKNDSLLISKIVNRLNIFDAKMNSYENALLRHTLAMSHITAGNYGEGLTNSLQALSQFQYLKDEVFSAKTYRLLGITCYRTKNYEMAEKYYQQSLSVELTKSEHYMTLLNMYNAQVFIEDRLDEAIKSLSQFLPVLESYGNKGLLMIAYLNIGGYYSINRERDKAIEYYTKSLNLAKEADCDHFMVSLHLNMAIYCITSQNFKEAAGHLDICKTIASRHNNKEQLSTAYYLSSTMFAHQNNIDSAYYYLDKHNLLRESITNSYKTIDSYQTYVSTFLESAEKELTIAEQKITLRNRWITTIIISAISLTLLVVFIFIFIHQKRKQQILIKEAEKRELEDRLQHEKYIQKLQEENYQEILEAKIREITSYSLLLSNKNNILSQLSELTKQLSNSSKEKAAKINQEINTLITSNLNTDNERNNFMHHFNKVHPSFFDKLKEMCNNLTENNLRMCAYFRIGMSAKQVAQILNVSTETIKNGRYRLKRKLGLEEEQDLDDFIRNI